MKSNTETKNSSAQFIKYQHIAPATEISTSDGKIMSMHKYMPRMHNDSFHVDQTQSVARRNARERNRVKQVNDSFAKLRQHIPQYVINDLTKGGGRGPQKKISKVDTLRIAVEYIRRLQDLVDDLNDSSSVSGISDNSTCSSFSFPASSLTTRTATPGISTKQCYNEQNISPLPAFEHRQIQIQPHQKQPQQYQSILTSTAINQTQLNVDCHSPTSSFNSSMSFDSGHFETAKQMSPVMASRVNASQLGVKFEAFNSFNLHEEDCSPDDEEILDYISLWQDQQF